MPVIKIRRGTTQQWAASNRVLQLGELGLDTTLNKLKAGNGSTAWSSLAFLQADADVTELAQDAVATALASGTHSNITVTYDDATNKISLATGADVVTTTSLSNTLTNATTGYVSVADVGNADGVASLDATGKVPDSEIPTAIARLASPTFTGTVGGITKSMVGLANVDNTTDALKPISTAAQNALDLKAPLASPALTGTATAVNLTISGDLIVNGTTTNLNSTNLVVEDKNVILGDTATPTDATADGGGITLKGTTDKTLNWVDATDSWTSSEHLNLASGKSLYLNGTLLKDTAETLTNKTLTSPVINTPTGITKSDVGLANVDNTTDANKPVSTATQTALDLKLNLSDPSVDYYITNSGVGAYLVNGVSNGIISFEKGKKYRIHVNASGHPFWIQTVSGQYSSGNVYSTGITNGGAQVGHILVELPQNAPDNLYYACEYHSSMAGSILTLGNVDFTSTPRTVSATSYTPVLSDLKKTIVTTAASTVTVTIDTNANVPFPTGTTLSLLQTGTGQLVIAPAAGVTIKTTGDFNALKNRYQFSGISLYKYDTNSWVLFGDTII